MQQAELIAHVEQITLNEGMDDKFSDRSVRLRELDSGDSSEMENGGHEPPSANRDVTAPASGRRPLPTTFGS